MKKFKVSFYIKGHGQTTIIFASSSSQAVVLCKQQFPEASSISASEVP